MFAKYWKSAIAFLTPFVALLTTVSVDPDVRAALPGVSGWLVVVGIPAVAGVLAFLKRNAQTAEQVDVAIEKGEVTLAELRELIEQRTGTPEK